MFPPIRFCSALLVAAYAASAIAHPVESTVRVNCEIAQISGTLLLPHTDKQVPCVVLIGGTLSQDRNGRMAQPGVPRRDALLRWAEALQAGGYASLRYDPVGRGESKPKETWRGTYSDQAVAAAAVIDLARRDDRLGAVIVAGESAGAYVACLAAKTGTQADAYLFLGPLCSPAPEMYDYNFTRLVQYAGTSPENMAWATKSHRYELALGRHHGAMFEAAKRGENSFELIDGDFQLRMDIARRREELEMPPNEMFRHIRSPALALSGAGDRNVPPDHAERAARIMREAGNSLATHETIAGVDHSFQKVAANEAQQWRDRYDMTSFRRPYSTRAYLAAIEWLHKVVPTPADSYPEQVALIAARPVEDAAAERENAPALRAVNKTEVDPVTDNTPERIQLAPGIEIIADITNPEKTAGVATLEGRIGPLILGTGSQAHFIDMPAGMFVGEHPHSSESLIYTVRGQWVLCSAGRRHVMQPGTLFRFGANIPTGYEVPFQNSAYILIFKGDRLTKVESEFVDYLRGMAARVEKEHREGVPYLLKDLPADHPARQFARQVNPRYETELGIP